MQDALLEAVEVAVAKVVEGSRELMPLILFGAPVRYRGRVYNSALAVHRGRLLGVVPKVHLPNYREFYERRHFASGEGTEGGTIALAGMEAPFGPDLLFCAEDVPSFVVHAEICEDLWVPIPVSSEAALAGATVLANLSASNITIGKAETRRSLCLSQSARCISAYLYAAAGAGESTTDLAWDGQAEIFENGVLLAETERFPTGQQMAIADVDLDLLRQERARTGTFDDNRRRHRAASDGFRRIPFRLDPPTGDIGLLREVERFPFVPADPERLALDCYEAYNIQVAGLAQRLEAIGVKRAVIGISGGLDSTQALIVTAKAFERLGLPRENILAFTMPGFATSERTKGNAERLMRALGVAAHELDIRPAAKQMLADMDHPFARGEEVYDVTFENVQAGLRTDYLFRLANQHGGIVIGTGDLSELALGWCTYGVGDQMSHYNVNSGVPKTLIQHLIRWVISSRQFDDAVAETLELDPEDRDHAGARAGRRGGDAAEHGGQGRSLRPARLQPLLHAALWLPPVEDRVPGASRMGRRGEGRVARRLSRRAPPRLRSRHDQRLAPRLSPALLRLQPVQALGDAERPQGRGGRGAVAARRLAGAVRWERPRLAQGARRQRAGRLIDMDPSPMLPAARYGAMSHRGRMGSNQRRAAPLVATTATDASVTNAKVRFLSSPDAYPERPARVDVVETHLSFVFLAGERVFKLKKPVKSEYFDFTTLAGREANCRNEVRLNRRLANGVYQGVARLVLTAEGGLAIDADGETVDWLVVMRRLPEDRMLDRMIAQGSVGPPELERLSERLAEFYARQPAAEIEGEAYLRRFTREQAINRAVLAACAGERRSHYETLLGRLDAALAKRGALFVEQARSGAICGRPRRPQARARLHEQADRDLRLPGVQRRSSSSRSDRRAGLSRA